MNVSEMRVDVLPCGPYTVTGGVPLVRVKIVRNAEKEAVTWEETYRYPAMDAYILCRCGGSKHKPFCDGTHIAIGFDGTETASKAPYEEGAKMYSGEEITLHDNKHFCVHAGFCDRGNNAWVYTEHSSDPEARAIAIEEARDCPSGRLRMFLEAEGVFVEPDFPEPSIALIEDPVYSTSGPIWVRGGITVCDASGEGYEPRNRQALCRCGTSANKPFCNGNHYKIDFKDGFEEG